MKSPVANYETMYPKSAANNLIPPECVFNHILKPCNFLHHLWPVPGPIGSVDW